MYKIYQQVEVSKEEYINRKLEYITMLKQEIPEVWTKAEKKVNKLRLQIDKLEQDVRLLKNKR